MRPKLHILTGPTAVGKTDLALAWAERRGAEIVSCDASLFYCGMDIGTAKPSAAERARVRHWCIDICEVGERMDVTRYVALARAACEDIASRGRPILVTGGSGFYLKCFFGPVADNWETPATLRTELAARLAGDGPPGEATPAGLDDLLTELRLLNPEGIGSLDVRNPRRVLRALERCRVSGLSLLELAAAFSRQPGPFDDWEVSAVVLERDPAELRQRIEHRAGAMLRDGLVDEVRRLRTAGIERNPSAAGAIGYRETLEALRQADAGGPPVNAHLLATEIALHTWGLARRQRTWFRTQLPAERVRVLPAQEARADSLF